ncbi:MAG: hypothetical protein ING71_01560 [Rhodocyclaceae bacterium]|nr:hypothetical protein [Rhodocyclaceae bacterium]MCA3041784.1 hypothetical protein [Rhodocyclaceae bacterium]MCA3047777.1 hypothetical protein [Rhodocyclaceae bacterium]MCA3050576.1 hypothetical protein [Rhodocyclaceae bacterium]MCA3056859.1 hypothetical protein [Rhodocyclaceae bacterium]
MQAVLEELRTHYQVQTFIAVLKARNFRSEALLRKLGFVDAPEQEQARYRDESDEMVMVKSARRTSPA